MRRFFGLGFLALAATFQASADTQLITNGGFEAGSLAGWTTTSSAGSGGMWLADNSTLFTPLSGNPTNGPDSGSWYAVTDQFGPGTNALSQTFTVPVSMNLLTLSFNMFVDDWATTFDPATNYLSFGILAAGSDVLTSPFLYTGTVSGSTLVSGGVPNPYVSYSIDLSSFLTAGNTYILDFVESDSAGPMNVGLDNVSLTASALPEPGGLWTCLFGLVALAFVYRRRFV